MISLLVTSVHRSIFKDYAVLYFGSASFKIMRLLIIALFSIHFFACTFYRVKNESAVNPDDVANFYTSRNVDPEVACTIRLFVSLILHSMMH